MPLLKMDRDKRFELPYTIHLFEGRACCDVTVGVDTEALTSGEWINGDVISVEESPHDPGVVLWHAPIMIPRSPILEGPSLHAEIGTEVVSNALGIGIYAPLSDSMFYRTFEEVIVQIGIDVSGVLRRSYLLYLQGNNE